jgi:hypothetical protein
MSSAIVAALEVVLQREQAPAMEELRRELAAAHRANSDLQRHVGWLEAQHEGDMMELVEEKDELEQRLNMLEQHLEVARDFRVEQHSIRVDRETFLALEGDRLVRWAVGRMEDVPIEIMRAAWVMQQTQPGTFSFVEMEVDSAALP